MVPALTGLPLCGECPPSTENTNVMPVTAGKYTVLGRAQQTASSIKQVVLPPLQTDEETEARKGKDDITKVYKCSEWAHLVFFDIFIGV